MTAHMSDTDKTKPWKVKAFFYPGWVEEYHDHRDGTCNLPEKPTVQNIDWWTRGKCGWTYSDQYRYDPMSKCGCRWCSKREWWGAQSRKNQRHAARRYCKGEWENEY